MSEKQIAQEKEDLQFLLSTKQGLRFFARFLDQCGFYKTSFDNSGSKVYFNEGGRAVGLAVMDDINNANPDAYINILKAKKEIDNG